jgi:hypothetical protein
MVHRAGRPAFASRAPDREGMVHYDAYRAGVKGIDHKHADAADYLISLRKTLPSFRANWTSCRILMSRSGSPFTAMMSA